MARKKDKRVQNIILNSNTYISYLTRLRGLALSMFEWVNLPPEINVRFLENTLLTKGYIIFFKEPDIGYATLSGAMGGQLDIYNEPTLITVYAPNGFQRTMTNEECVVIYNNETRTPIIKDLQMYAEKLYNIERAIDLNINVQKTPFIVSATKENQLTVENILMQLEGFEEYILTRKSFDMNKAIDVLKLDAPYLVDNLQSHLTKKWNEALTVMGIANVNVDKKERLSTDEVNLNMGSVIAQQYIRLNPRKQACKKINEMFGLDVDVRFRNDILIENGGGDSE